MREGRGLADHPVGGLGSERELETDRAVLARGFGGELDRPRQRWTRVVGDVTA